MLGVALGLVYANASEWLIHRFVLHGLGKKKTSFWNFHWGEHHRAARKHDFLDPDYRRSMFGKHAQGKEALAVFGLMLAHLPLIKVAPWFTGTVWYSGLNYLCTHRKAHLDPEWAKRHLKHHYDHHMGLDQDKNWCVTRPWADVLLGTRVNYEYDERGRPKKLDQPQVAPVPMAQEGAVDVANDQEKSAA